MIIKLNKKGSALMLTYLVLAVLAVFASAFVNSAINQKLSSEIFKRRTKAFDLAEAGLDHAVYWLRAQPSAPIGDKTNPWGSVQSVGGGSYSVTITDLGIVAGSGNARRYKIISTGSFGSMNRTLSNILQVDVFSRYLWFTQGEVFDGTTVWFWSQDHLNGPTHTNGHFNIYGNPVFEAQVESVDNYITFYNNGNNVNLQQTSNAPYDQPDFQGGAVLGTDPATMPNQALNLRSAASSSGGLSFKGSTTIVFKSNGTMNVTNAAKGWTNQNMALPTNGAIFVACSGSNCSNGGDLTISGTLNGRITVGAERDVVIPNNIVYADNPQTNPSSDDTLGIIAERDVVVASNAPTNLEVDASIMALDASFMMENYWTGPAKGTLTVYGGIIQQERGPVGTFNGTTGQKVSGYSKNYLYDSRLLASPPPFMPSTGDYVTLSWEGN